MASIYLDNNATTRIDPRVAEVVFACYREQYANPSSQHGPGRRARRVLEQSREVVARVLGCDPGTRGDRVLFTSGGTEANQLAILGLAGSRPGRVLISSIEHASVVGAADRLQRSGLQVDTLRVSSDGVIDLEDLERRLQAPTRLVSVMLGNNETGVIQPVRAVAALCEARGIPFHTDAVQAVGKIPVEFGQLAASAMTLTAHKLHGPVGIGALILRRDLVMEPIWSGGPQEQGLRPGTEAVPLVVGFAEALRIWEADARRRGERMEELRNRLEAGLLRSVPDLVIHGHNAERLPQTSHLAFPGLDRQTLMIALDLAGISCSTGSACASGSSEPSPVLMAMGVPRHLLESSLRFSLGADTRAAEIERAIELISQLVIDLRSKKSVENSAPPSRAAGGILL